METSINHSIKVKQLNHMELAIHLNNLTQTTVDRFITNSHMDLSLKDTNLNNIRHMDIKKNSLKMSIDIALMVSIDYTLIYLKTLVLGRIYTI